MLNKLKKKKAFNFLLLKGQSVTKERKYKLVRLNLKQKDKNPLCNQQTKARKYKFLNPTGGPGREVSGTMQSMQLRG